jgi:hypothetical protein
VSVRIYVEGGGNPLADTDLRQSFSGFFRRVVADKDRPKVIAGGSRNATYDLYRNDLHRFPSDVLLLLVDSETPVAEGTRPWAHLNKTDGWDRPDEATDDQAHLMVQCMEAWFLADKQALSTYFGQGFRLNALPRRSDVEAIPKGDVLRALGNASRDCRTKGRYHKTDHGFEILARIDPARVRAASQHADRLCLILLQVTPS